MLPKIKNKLTPSRHLPPNSRALLNKPLVRVNNTSWEGEGRERLKHILAKKDHYFVNRNYHLDFSDYFLDYTDELRQLFNDGKYKSIHIFGNSPCLSKVPESIFKDDKILKIGLNRAYIQGYCHILIWTDKKTIFDIDKHSSKYDLSKTVIVKSGGEIGIDISTEAYRRVTYRDFAKYYIDSVNRKGEELFEAWPYNCLMMAKTVLTSALHLAYKILQDNRDIPIILDGVSMDRRDYFYSKSINRKNHQHDKPYGLNKANGIKLSDMGLNSDSIKISHTSIVTDIVTDLINNGFNISYTAESRMLSKIKGLTCLQY